MIRQFCCDPHKLTYISGIITAIESLVFIVLNVVLICMKTCVIPPSTEGGSFFDTFRAWYFLDTDACIHKGHDIPLWTSNEIYPIQPRPSTTTVDTNFICQIIYLILHVLWFLSVFILLYGNAKKRWGYYLPWLSVTLALIIMDVTISSFYISDMVSATLTTKQGGAMFFILAMYFRFFILWIMNLSEFGNALNAFCKSYHKRSKQSRLQKVQQEQHAIEITAAVAETEAKVRAEYEEPPQPLPPIQQPQPQPPPQQSPPLQYDQYQESGYNNLAYEDHPPPQPKKQPPPVPKKPKAPPGARPFNYLNPFFRPANHSDLEGMRAHAIHIPDSPTRLLKKPTEHPEASDYFPTDGYSRPKDLRPNAPKRHDSMRNFRTQEPPQLNRRYASARGDPRNTPYTPPPDYDRTLGRPRHARDHQNPMPRVNLESSSSVRQGYRPPQVSTQPHHNPPPTSPTRHYSPTPPTRHYSPTPPTRHYSPTPASSSGHNPSYRQDQPVHSQRDEDVLYF
ncbi:hypothetical protein Pmani_010379 [Petrolisthes manimaculis]|uniref:Uncharacterized protein n=1 Tax=Petrolisthes manimaculis TaxID=1843537 RepID=A0AAE1UCQ9_9EUCA|nr:hypothetical protein Pmani_010379 [Petrolisthes manimaculis]